jgi:hypothetical protein
MKVQQRRKVSMAYKYVPTAHEQKFIEIASQFTDGAITHWEFFCAVSNYGQQNHEAIKAEHDAMLDLMKGLEKIS